ncbi:MAG: tripartite tricarboxylate transporter TctB family protein [Roseovarius sp.]
MKTAHKRDFLLGLIACALALIILFGILPWAVKAPQVIPNLALSPTFWPRIILVAIAVFAALLAFRAYYDKVQDNAPPHGDTDEPPFDASDLRVVFAAALTVLFCILLKPLGVVLPSILLLIAMIVLHEPRKWPQAIAVSVLFVAALYLFFRFVAKVPVPLGPLNGLF